MTQASAPTTQEATSMDRRSFLVRGAAVSAGLLATGVLGASGSRAFALTLNDVGYHRNTNRGLGLEKSALATIDRQDVRCRLAILSDAHVYEEGDRASLKLTRALETMQWVTPGIDGVFVLGDLTYQGTALELDAFANVTAGALFEHYPHVPPVHLVMGNHDLLQGSQQKFEAFFAAHSYAPLFEAEQNSVATFAGVTVIKLSGTGGVDRDEMDYSGTYEFLAAALAEAASERPEDAILVVAHEPARQMSLPEPVECGNYGQGTERDLIALIASYPQARFFSGHIHNPLDVPETINHDLGFTSVHTSTVGSCFFVRNELIDYDESGSHGLVLDVCTDGRLLLHRLDFTRQEYLGEPVVI